MRDPLEEKTRDTAKTNKKAGTPRSGLQDLIPVKEAVEQRLGQMSRNVRTNVRATNIWTFISSLTRSNRPFLDPFFRFIYGFRRSWVVYGFGRCSAAAPEMEMVRLLRLLPPDGKIIADSGSGGEAATVFPFLRR